MSNGNQQQQQPGDMGNYSHEEPDSNRAHLLFGGVQFSDEETKRLKQSLNMKLSGDFISYRPGGGGNEVAYVEQWLVFDIANKMFGFNGWSRSIQALTIDYGERRNGKFEVGVSCIVRVTLKDGAFHEDLGYGSAVLPTKHQALEKAKKQAVTDATKRALKMFGQVFGQCLNDKDYRKFIRPMAKKKKMVDFNDTEMMERGRLNGSGEEEEGTLDLNNLEKVSVATNQLPVPTPSMAPLSSSSSTLPLSTTFISASTTASNLSSPKHPHTKPSNQHQTRPSSSPKHNLSKKKGNSSSSASFATPHSSSSSSSSTTPFVCLSLSKGLSSSTLS
eukprot:m.94781 g.94781  ORF g.94781 m.94781 type:complete len:332 (+) comp8931_c1_seq1:553-1548(+)